MRIVFLYLILLPILPLFGQQENIITYNNNLVFTMDHASVMVKFNAQTSLENRSAALNPQYFEPFNFANSDINYFYAFVPLKSGLSNNEIFQAVEELSNNNSVAYTSMMFRDENDVLCAPTNKIFVQLKSGNMWQDMMQLLNTTFADSHITVTQKYFAPNTYVIEFDLKNTASMFAFADALYTSGYFNYCEINLVSLINKLTDDTYYNRQWSINNIGSAVQYSGTPGADLDILCAWEYTKGDGIKVAIIDEGVDLTHDDLTPNLVEGYDAVYWGGGTGSDTQGSYKAGSDDAHGTNCAGIVAAVADNGIGVTGIAPESKVVPVRIAYSDAWGGWVYETFWGVDAVEWCIDNANADILSNSWGGGSASTAFNGAIEYAVTEGRDGLGAVFIAAAGNSNVSEVHYPGNNINAIGVAATSMCDERKSTSSCDGEYWWGSNYGTALDVAAPGVKMPSTDISGSAGYNSGDYNLEFNGTSSATPAAAAVVALILAYNPALTYEEVRFLLESTCEKVGGYTYNENASHPNSTWTSQLGYGRVNACLALEAATAPDILCGIEAFTTDTVYPGENYPIEMFIQNNGFAGSEGFENGIYLSEDCSAEDAINLTNFYAPAIISGETIIYNSTMEIPEYFEAGDYEIVLVADNNNAIAEYNELNNLACRSIYIACEFSPQSSEVFYDKNAITDSLQIESTSGCSWEVTPAPPSWISIINNAGTGEGYFIYSLNENMDNVNRSFSFQYGSNTFTINQDFQQFDIETILSGISIYPNPVNTILNLTLEYGTLENAEYAVINMMGQTIANGSLNGREFTFNLQGLPAAAYILQISAEDKTALFNFIKN
ncbi:MAG: S8 family serine peptidase [Chitinophagales bacterium]|nr:S8 family serine peptidase [Chitinophagales bacterium]MBP8753142.1 S8 family serine peptidase [Chitinophagales bacterium]